VEACSTGQKIGHLLKTSTGSPYTYAGLRSAWDRCCKRAGVVDLHIHDLRGRAGVDALEGSDLEAARALLGHRTQRMTAHYTHGKHVPKVKPAR
jgi:integrase